MAGRNSTHRTAPYPPRRIRTPTWMAVNRPVKTPRPAAEVPQGVANRHDAYAQAPIGSSTVRMLVGDTTPGNDVVMAGSDAGEVENDRVQDYDVDASVSAVGAPTPGALHFWSEAAAGFISSTSGLDHTWVGKRPLGQGSFGIAGVWEKHDANGNVVDTVVIKQIGVRERDRARNRPWDGDMPHEVMIMRELNDANCDSIVKIKAYKRYPHQQIHRIYLEYCPYGDLRKLYKRYRQFRRYMPETFLWVTFRNLVAAVRAMHDGPLDKNGNRIWDFEIVHRDLKPQNIFLGNEPSLNSDYSFYPTSKLGDFGLAEKTGPDDHRNPRELQGAGTPLYLAPEQQIPHGPLPPYVSNGRGRLGHATNLWAVGATMYELLTLHHAKSALYSDYVDDIEGEGLPEIHTHRNPEYSAELRRLIRMCLRPDPFLRPDFGQLEMDLAAKLADMARISRLLGANEHLSPQQSERLYYRDNEINSMQIGDFVPTRWNARDVMEESGFKDPYVTSIRFPRWNVRADMEEGDTQSIPDEDVRRIMADSMAVGGGTGATDRDDATMGTDGNNNDDKEDDEDDVTVIPPRPRQNQLNKFGRAKMAW